MYSKNGATSKTNLDAIKKRMAKERRKNSWYNKAWNNIKEGYTKEDAIGAGVNTVSSIIGNIMNKNMLDNMSYRSEPVAKRAAKMKTTYNINPQLDAVNRNLAETEDNIDENTSSSRVALARKQQARNNALSTTNQLYGQKENIETQLINQDRLNQQQVNNANIDAYNTWAAGKAEFDNSIAEKRAENNISLINNLSNTVSDMINRKEQRIAENDNIRTTMSAYPNVNPRRLKDMGVSWVTDKMVNDWELANKKNSKSI